MRADLETSSRCAMAALDVLSREIGLLKLSAEQGKRLTVLARITREHVAEIVEAESATLGEWPDGEMPAKRSRTQARPGKAPVSPGRNSLEDQATQAWAAVAALRQAPTITEARRCRERLSDIHLAAHSASVRRLCEFGLETEHLRDQ